MALIRGSDRGSELEGLDTLEGVALAIRQEEALLKRAERKQADARVRHSNFELIQRVIGLALLVLIVGLTVITGLVTNPELLPLALPASGLVGVIGALIFRRSAGDSRS